MEYIAVVDCFRRLDQCSKNIYQVHYPAFAAGKLVHPKRLATFGNRSGSSYWPFNGKLHKITIKPPVCCVLQHEQSGSRRKHRTLCKKLFWNI